MLSKSGRQHTWPLQDTITWNPEPVRGHYADLCFSRQLD